MIRELSEMAVAEGVCAVIAEVLEREVADLRPETYVFRDLETESIDLLEYGIGLGSRFGVRVRDDLAFLKRFRTHCATFEGESERIMLLQGEYPHLSEARLREMERGYAANPAARPMLQIRDICAYVLHASGAAR